MREYIRRVTDDERIANSGVTNSAYGRPMSSTITPPRARWCDWRTDRRGTRRSSSSCWSRSSPASSSAGYGRTSASALKPLADGFIKLIKMLIAPIIFCTVVLGIAHVGDLKSVGRIGVKALIYFEVVTTFALLFGLVIGNVVKPGAGFNIDPQTLATGADAIATEDRQRRTAAHRRVPAEHHPDVGGLRIRRERAAAGAVLRGAVRPGAGQARRARPAGDPRGHRPVEPHLLHHHRLDHAVRAAGRVRRDGVHHRPVRHRFAGQLRQAHRRLLSRGACCSS